MTVRAGYQAFAEDGTLICDTNDVLFTFLGSFSTGGSYPESGTITDSNLSLGTHFFFVTAIVIPSGGNQYIGQAPKVSFSGNTLSYSWTGASAGVVANIIYGVR